MTQISTAAPADFWLRGSQLGMDIFRTAEGIKDARARREAEAERAAFGQELAGQQLDLARDRHALDLSQYELQRKALQDRQAKEAEEKASRLKTADAFAGMLRNRIKSGREAEAQLEQVSGVFARGPGAYPQIGLEAMRERQAAPAQPAPAGGGTLVPSSEPIDPAAIPDLANVRAGRDARDYGRPQGSTVSPANGPSGTGPVQAGMGGVPGGMEVRRRKIEPDPFEFDPQQDPIDRDYERAITAAQAVGDLDTLKVLSESIDDVMKRREDLVRGRMIIATLGDPEWVSDSAPRDKALAKIGMYLQRYDLVFKAMEGNREELSRMTPSEFRASIAGLSRGELDDEELDSWTRIVAGSKYSPMIMGQAVQRAQGAAGQGKMAMDVTTQQLKIAQQDVQAIQRQINGAIAAGVIGEKQLPELQKKLVEAVKIRDGLLNQLGDAAGLPSQDGTKRDFGTIMVGDKEVSVNDTNVEKAKALAQDARAQFIRIHKREPDVSVGSADLPELKEIHSRLIRSAGAVE